MSAARAARSTGLRPVIGTVLVLLVCGYAGLAALLYFQQTRLVFVPSTHLGADPSAFGLDFETVWLDTEDGERLHAWWVPAPRSAGRTVLFLHGNAGNISHRMQTLRVLNSVGVDVLILDYRGYGRSSGTPSEAGTGLDALAGWQHLREARARPAAAIAVHGRSLGGAVALQLASQVEPGALVLESTFTSVPALGAETYPWLPVRWLARIHYPNLQRIAALRAPVLLLHGRDDRLIGFHHSEALASAAAPGAEVVALQGGHNDAFLVSEARYREHLQDFLRRHLRPAGSSP